MNLFDYTYCGNYNRQIQNLSRIVPEKWSFGSTEDNGILKGYSGAHFSEGNMRKAKYWKQITMQFLIQDYLIAIISRSMFILSQILSRTGRDGSWRDFIRNTIFSKLEL